MKPPEGWRWLKIGETLTKGDKLKVDPTFVNVRQNAWGRKIISGDYIRRLPGTPARKPRWSNTRPPLAAGERRLGGSHIT